jgi:hypothetical protein
MPFVREFTWYDQSILVIFDGFTPRSERFLRVLMGIRGVRDIRDEEIIKGITGIRHIGCAIYDDPRIRESAIGIDDEQEAVSEVGFLPD